jgi:protein-L-isoaspartate(D-aspartate) O-methyltransferase
MSHPDFQAQRVKMVDGQLRTTDVTNHELLSAFLSVPRELFVGEGRQELAYLDDDIQIAPGRFIMEPSPLAKMMQLAAINETDSVLIIGAGTGYSAAIASKLAAKVVALESDQSLAQRAEANLAALNVSNVDVVCSELTQGAASKGPFDVILLEGAISSMPAALFEQLSDNGRLVVVEGLGLTGVAKCYVKSGKSTSASRGFNLAVKPLPGFQSTPVFSF